jgi:RNA 2',3'-cyclic 3'-phosphodiesterase
MPDSIRTFIAIKIPSLEPLRRVLKELAGMGRALKTVDPDNLHVTLKFLGQTDMNLVPEVRALMEQAARSSASCELTITGLGVFPHAQRPNVVWAGLQGSDTLASLAADLEAGLEPQGFPRENRPFVPHLTLARVKARPPESLRDLLSRHAKSPFGTVAIDHLEFIRSEPGPDGSQYTILATTPLGAGSASQ